jgi:L-asparaginase
MNDMKLRIITTGGTIDKVYFDALSTHQIGAPQIVAVLAEANIAFDYILEEACRKDSLELTDDDRAEIRKRIVASPERYIVITHGTDTMTETAKCLEGIADKVIVFTGAMAPARFRSTDAVFNIGTAIAAVQVAQPGVYIAMNGRIFAAASARKNRNKGQFETWLSGLLTKERACERSGAVPAPSCATRLPQTIAVYPFRNVFDTLGAKGSGRPLCQSPASFCQQTGQA